MRLEKLGMMLFLEYWNQLNDVKYHLSRSLAELIKALEETLKIVQKGSQQLSVHPVQDNILAKLFGPLRSLLHYSEQKCESSSPSTPDTPHPPEIKAHIIQSLIDALEQEMAHITAEEAMHNPLKIKALESVKTVLLEQQVDRQVDRPHNPRDKSPPLPADEIPIEEEDVVISLAGSGAASTLHFQADREDRDGDVIHLPRAKTA